MEDVSIDQIKLALACSIACEHAKPIRDRPGERQAPAGERARTQRPAQYHCALRVRAVNEARQGRALINRKARIRPVDVRCPTNSGVRADFAGGPGWADIVAKVENRREIIFPPKDDVTGDRRSLCSQSRYEGRQ
jgi:hypothetical protein